jgi:hypothetical protein
MKSSTWLRGVAIAALILSTALPAHAQKFERLRPDTDDMRRLLLAGMQRSPTFGALVAHLEKSDLIVEVQCGHFSQSSRLGRTVLLTVRPGVRYVLAEIACGMTWPARLDILGHELRHAVEIADATWVVDEPSLSRLYTRIGFSTCGVQAAGHGEFETEDALEAGGRVHHELSHPAASTRPVAQVTK